ncbi:MAG: hypothetical protein IJK52_00545 [Oscillospiraceae bacterium]|nr:hypothetical protein [Oscillospiraceae bacterium]
MGTDFNNMTLNTKIGSISGNGVGVQFNVQNNAAAPDDNAQILRELQSVRERLNETSDVAKAVDELTEAVKAKDKPAIDKLLTQFAGGTMKAVITAIASKTLLSWMGIS